ncbi:MAG: response regulator [Owenweeksia sp.]
MGFLGQIRIKRIRLQSQLVFEQREASRIRELEQLKSRFYSNITHEFRTPLTLILGPVESLLTLEKKNEKRNQLINIQEHAQQLLELINQLLDLSKLENNKMAVNWERGDLRLLVHEVIQSFNQAAAQKSINLKPYIPQSFPVFDFDAGKLRKVGRNLLSNALKFTPEQGSIEIHLEYLPNEPGQHWVKWIFKDNGIGIPASELANIFGRFYQVQNEAKPFVEGTGIGLSLSKELSESFGGKISVQSDTGKGSTFTVHIPLIHHAFPQVVPTTDQHTYKNISSTLSDTSAIEEEEEEDKLIPEREIVLLIEDHNDLRKFMRSSLTGKYHVIEATNGRTGLETAFKQVPDLIVSDVMMPEMDGYELCEKLKRDERTSHIPVIMLTAKASLEDKLKGIEEGADAYLTKPFSPKELEVRIRKLLEGRNLLQQKFSSEGSYLTGISFPESTRDRERTFLAKARDVVLRFLADEEFDVEDFCREIGMSRTQLHRKLKALTNQSTTAFVRSIRLNVALTMLRKGTDNVTEVAYAVGFSSQAYFSKCFQKKFGFPPSQVNTP